MKLAFVYWGYGNAGSMLDLRGYARVARDLGHEVAMYGPPNPAFALDYSKKLSGVDALVFVVEWTTELQFGDRLDWVRLMQAVPRRRRVVIDCDGAYNDPMEYGGDYNHVSLASSRHWIAVCDSLSDKIFQPTLRPKRANVRPFLFHIYDPTWEAPLTFADKEFSMVYVGHTKFRWRGMSKVLRAIERVREKVGRIALVGEGWGAPEDWMEWDENKPRFFVDRDYLKKVGAEAHPPVPYARVAETINKGVFNPVVYRPLFEHLGLVTCRTFETPAAGTIPLFLLERDYVAEIFGERATELMLDEENAHEKIVDVLERPERYAQIVMGIREDFRRLHSPEARLRELVRLIEE
jgi:glycosyltransferase involved in cell wall biosynthesis